MYIHIYTLTRYLCILISGVHDALRDWGSHQIPARICVGVEDVTHIYMYIHMIFCICISEVHNALGVL